MLIEQRRLTSGQDDEIPFEHAAAPTPVEWLRFILVGLGRRKVIAALVFGVVALATFVYYAQMVPEYRAAAKVLAQRSQGMPTAVRSTFDEQPSRTAWEVVHQRENLIAIIRQTRLLEEPPRTPPLPAWKRWLSLGGQGGAPGKPEPGAVPKGAPLAVGKAGDDTALEDLVTALDKGLKVIPDDDGSILLRLDWPDPDQAHAIVQAALQNFLEARHVQEVTSMDAVISVLLGRTAMLRDNLEKVTEQARRRASQPAPAPISRVRLPSEELIRLQASVEAKQRALQDVEDFQRRRLAELQAQLDQARTMLSDAHPTVIGLRRDIEAFGRESPQVLALRQEERQLRKQLSERLAREDFPGGARVTAPTPTVTLAAPVPGEEPAVRDARVQYEQMAARTTAAQVELDAARAAFKYRYNVVWPTQVSREPVAPKPMKTFALGLLLAVGLALLAAVGPDLVSGRIIQRWQVERTLGLPILGNVRRDV